MRKFNVNGTCVPRTHYMVDTTNKLEQIKQLIDKEEYFTINRGRQYGKTTTLSLLRRFLADEYTAISISFGGIGDVPFENEANFCQVFSKLISKALRFTDEPQEYYESWISQGVVTFDELSDHITDMCEGKKLVLMIDEVDKFSNNQVFLGFLGKLREKYLARADERDYTFHSVILVGVYDIKNIKLHLIQEGLLIPTKQETMINNSPWNIAADFKVDMSFSAPEIETMLIQYEEDYQTGMVVSEVAAEIYHYTGGYPVLVSRVCKHIDEELSKEWTVIGVKKAVKLILNEDSPLFQSLTKNLIGNKEFAEMIYDILMRGSRWSFTYDNPLVGLGVRYNYLKEVDGSVAISNIIFAVRMANYFVSRDRIEKVSAKIGFDHQTDIIVNGRFDMETCLIKFAKYYHEHYSDKDVDFLHDEARYLVLFFLNSILNGKGFVHNEDQFRDGRKMDLVVNYLNQQFVIELKIWRGAKRHQEGYEQLLGYMNKKGLREGYMLTFDFNEKKQTGSRWVKLADGCKIFDIRV